MRMFFGPVTDQPSWHWVGADVARRLAERNDIRYFQTLDEIPDGSLVFWIKHPGSERMAADIRRRRIVLLFFPVDCFADECHIARHRAFIDAASTVCLHARGLAPYFPAARIAWVDHYNKYGVAHAARSPGRSVLWIGAYQYLPYLVYGLCQLARRPREIGVLTDHSCPRAQAAAARHAEKIGMPDFARRLDGLGVVMRAWSVPAQRDALLTCAAAFDYKFTDCFNQRHKPPTKIQKYLCSGIPCAINPQVPFQEQLGVDLGTLEELDRLVLDSGNAEAAAARAEDLSSRLALGRIASAYEAIAHRAAGQGTAAWQPE